MEKRKLNGGAAGIGFGISVFEAEGIESVSLTPQDHEGVVYPVPLKYLLANLRVTRRGSNPWMKELKRHMEMRQAKVLAARAEDADVIESNLKRRDEYEGIVLDIRKPKGAGLDQQEGMQRSVHDIIHHDGCISYNVNRLALQFGGLDQGFTEGGFAVIEKDENNANSKNKDDVGDEKIELDMYAIKKRFLPYSLERKRDCVVFSEKKAPTEIGPPSYTRAAPLRPGTNEWDQLYV